MEKLEGSMDSLSSVVMNDLFLIYAKMVISKIEVSTYLLIAI
jgi:hypothetical protein